MKPLSSLPLASTLAVLSAASSITDYGYDLSSLTQMINSQGAHFYTESGSASTAPKILGGTTARLRLWTAGVYNNDYTIALAKNLSASGYDILLDFHFSDTWADPDSQAIPSGWPTSLSSLKTKIQDYVEVTLYDFKEAGVQPTIVALGNEIINGMLFPTGEISDNNFDDFAQLWAAAREGVSLAVSKYSVSQPKVMIHLNNGWDESTLKWWYEGVLDTGYIATDDFDIMGFSFYPFYGTSATLSNLKTSMEYFASEYGKEIMIAETDWPEACSGVTLSESSIPVSAAGQVTWVDDIIDVLEALPDDLGTGIFYWEPAWINNTALGSSCSDNILFDVDWSDWPDTKVTARSSANLYG